MGKMTPSYRLNSRSMPSYKSVTERIIARAELTKAFACLVKEIKPILFWVLVAIVLYLIFNGKMGQLQPQDLLQLIKIIGEISLK